MRGYTPIITHVLTAIVGLIIGLALINAMYNNAELEKQLSECRGENIALANNVGELEGKLAEKDRIIDEMNDTINELAKSKAKYERELTECMTKYYNDLNFQVFIHFTSIFSILNLIRFFWIASKGWDKLGLWDYISLVFSLVMIGTFFGTGFRLFWWDQYNVVSNVTTNITNNLTNVTP